MAEYAEQDVEKLSTPPLVHDCASPDPADDDDGAEGFVMACSEEPADGDIFYWDAATRKIVPGAPPAGGGGTGIVTAIAGASVNTDQGTSSTSYTDLATSGPSVTLTTGTEVYITISAFVYRPSGTGNTSFVAVAVSGATTIAAADANCIALAGVFSGGGISISRRFKLTGLTAGSNTFTLKYKVDGSTFNFNLRSIVVEAV